MGISTILSDVSKRVLIVKGIPRLDDIVNKNKQILEIKPWGNDIYEVTITTKVGDYMPRPPSVMPEKPYRGR